MPGAGGAQQMDSGSSGYGARPRREQQRANAPRRQAAVDYSQYARSQGVPITAAARTAYQNAVVSGGGGTPMMGTGGGGGGGGGGRGYGGGGGGGGGGGMTQAQFDQAIALLGAGSRGPTLQAPQTQQFRGQNINPFQEAMYNQLRQQLSGAVATDTANVNQINQQTRGQLTQNYSNPYANMPVQGAPAPASEGAGLVEPGALQAGAATQQVENQNSQAAFQNLLGVLAGASDQSQNSRLHQLDLDRQTALNSIGAQNTGLGAQIGMQRNAAYEQWLQQDNQRRYDNSLMQQQWAREDEQRRADIANQQSQGQYTARNNVLQPLLDLLAGAGRGVNTASLQQLIAGMK